MEFRNHKKGSTVSGKAEDPGFSLHHNTAFRLSIEINSNVSARTFFQISSSDLERYNKTVFAVQVKVLPQPLH